MTRPGRQHPGTGPRGGLPGASVSQLPHGVITLADGYELLTVPQTNVLATAVALRADEEHGHHEAANKTVKQGFKTGP